MIVSIVPLPVADMPIFSAGPLAGVVIEDTTELPTPAEKAITQALRLTAAETRVALAFLEGSKPREIAEQLRISGNTVRVHFQNMLGKLGLRRQADLARVLERVIAAAGRHG